MINKKLTRVTKADLHRIVKESVNNILTEGNGRVIDESYKKYNFKVEIFGLSDILLYLCNKKE